MYHFIFNPMAGKRKSRKYFARVQKILDERGVSYKVHLTTREKGAYAIAKELTEQGEDEIIVLGGDGTLHEALNGIKDPSICRLGLIPCGTGNDFAAKAGIPMQPEKALALILDGTAKETDYLQIGEKRCMNVAGLGLDVEVLELCEKGRMRGKLKYLLSLTRCLFTYKGCKVLVESEGREEAHFLLIAAACNGTQFGGGISICPNAEIDDGKINVIAVDCIGGWWKLLSALIQLMQGKILAYPLTTHFTCERVHFKTEKPCSVQLDGEVYKDLDFDVEVKKGLMFYR